MIYVLLRQINLKRDFANINNKLSLLTLLRQSSRVNLMAILIFKVMIEIQIFVKYLQSRLKVDYFISYFFNLISLVSRFIKFKISNKFNQLYIKKIFHKMMTGSSQKFMKESGIYDQQQLDSFRQLEGDCKIESVRYLKFSLLKSILLMIPITLSIVGLFVLKYYVQFRVKVFYNQSQTQEATHILIIGQDDSKKIEKIFIEQNIHHFIYRKLKYKIVNEQIIPIGLNWMRFYRQNVSQDYIKRGLKQDGYKIQLGRYGKNQHLVFPPSYFQYAFKEMTQPFFLIQYLAAVIYLVQKVVSLAILLLAASLLTVSLNYILLYFSYRKIKQMAQKAHDVQVIRSGQKKKIVHSDIVPGDIIILQQKQQIPCDCILLQGQAYVNQASLTGQSIPIGKFSCGDVNQCKITNRWLYEGSTILSVREQSLMLAIHTGYTSRRGRIIRKILTKKQKMPEFFKSVIYFLIQIYIIGGIITYFATFPITLNADIQTSMVVLLFFLFITFAFPPAFPIYFNLAYSLCLARLKFKNIHGTQPQKTISGTNLRIMCFDKTGTLTQEKVVLNSIYKLQRSESETQITHQFDKQENKLIKILFSTCHTVKQFHQQLQGDEIDLKMFLYTKSKINLGFQDGIKCLITDLQNKKYQILRINQYESKFQSMSVLVHDLQSDKYYVFAKGAPQKMHNFSQIKYNFFKNLISKLSYEGLRTIAFSVKQIKKKQVNQFLQADRQNFLKDTKILGVVAFQNKLKDDAIQTINRLKEANIQTKMITGDNIFIAIQTAMRAGIIEKQKQVVVIQGAQQKLYQMSGSEQQCFFKVKIVHIKDGQFHITESKYNYTQYTFLSKTIAVDNDFIELDPMPALVPHIKVFSRISPQNKAKIVRTYRNQFQQKRQLYGFFQKITGKPVQRVGMAGDGANDLIALKEADIGMGISNSDASYAATFSINNLLDIDEILRESKGTERSILQICRFYSITNYLSIPHVIMLLGEGSFFSDTQLTYLNLSKLIIINLAIPLSRAQPMPTKFKPQSNFLGLQNHLVFWGNVIIYTGGYVAAYCYGRYFSNQFISNPQPKVTFDSGYYHQTFSVTILFICFNIQPPTMALFLYKSKPWRQYIWNNIILFLIIVINIGIGIAAFFLTDQLSSGFQILGLSRTVQVSIFIIMLITVFLVFLWNMFVDCLKLHQSQYYSKEYKYQLSTEEV